MAFRAPTTSLGQLDAEATASLIAAASDIALVVDNGGVIRDLAVNGTELSRDMTAGLDWCGRRWLDTVTEESRAKVEALMRDVSTQAEPRWRHVNQMLPAGSAVPILYSAARIGMAGHAVMFGRDLRPIASLQQRLVEAQQSVERDYARLRSAETRYRLLFQLSPEPVLIVDAPSGRVQEMNPAAERLFGRAARRLPGRTLVEAFDREGEEVVRALLAGARAGGRTEEVAATLAEDGQAVRISASLLRQDGSATFLVRLFPVRPDAEAPALPQPKSRLLRVVESAPDALVVTDESGRILTANGAFLEMAQLATEEQAEGETLERWFGRPGVELEVLLATLRQRGSIRLFVTTIRGEHGASTQVEVSAAAVLDGTGRSCFGFAIRDIGIRPGAAPARGEPLRSVEQLKELIGRVPLKDLVREATDVIERLCIEAALQLTNDNRASAAEMLGLSRQSLYVKLRRYGFGELGAEDGEAED